jgi:hypothetical protein
MIDPAATDDVRKRRISPKEADRRAKIMMSWLDDDSDKKLRLRERNAKLFGHRKKMLVGVLDSDFDDMGF